MVCFSKQAKLSCSVTIMCSKQLKYETEFLKGCAGKVQHKNRLSAEYFLENKHSVTNSEIYTCDVCGFFHIGTIDNKNKTEIKNKNKPDNDQHKRKHKRFKY